MSLLFSSFFAGIGGFDLGFERAGMRCLQQTEINTACQHVLVRRWPNVEKQTDVREVKNAGSVDVICGGFPCQDLSVAGRRKGLAGERSGLWFEFLRIIAGNKPRWVVIENVPGLLSSNGGRDFAIIVQGLVKCGYGVAWRILDAQYFGVAQRRRRVFIVGSLGDGRCAKVLFESEGVYGDTAPRREARARVAACLDGSPYADREAEHSRLVAFAQNTRDEIRLLNGDGSISGALGAEPGMHQQTFVAGTMKSNGDAHSGFEFGDGIVPVVNCFNGYTGGADDNDAQASHIIPVLSPALRAEGHDASEDGKGRRILIPIDMRQASRGSKMTNNRPGGSSGGAPGTGIGEAGGPSSTIATSHIPAMAGCFGVRRLTPTECERLQGFPDGWTAGESDSTRYRMLGNAVCVPVAQWIGERIMQSVL